MYPTWSKLNFKFTAQLYSFNWFSQNNNIKSWVYYEFRFWPFSLGKLILNVVFCIVSNVQFVATHIVMIYNVLVV